MGRVIEHPAVSLANAQHRLEVIADILEDLCNVVERTGRPEYGTPMHDAWTRARRILTLIGRKDGT